MDGQGEVQGRQEYQDLVDRIKLQSRDGQAGRAQANPFQLYWLGSARTFISFEPLAQLSSIIYKF